MSGNRRLFAVNPGVNLLISPAPVGIIPVVSVGDILIGESFYQILKPGIKIVRERDTLSLGINGNILNTGILIRGGSCIKFVERDTERVIVGAGPEKTGSGFRRGIERGFTGLGDHHGGAVGNRADTEVNEHDMGFIIGNHHIAGL